MNDELRECCIEAGIVEGDALSRSVLHVDAGIAISCCGDKWFGWVDSRHGAFSEPPNEFSRQGARPAADVQHSLPGTNPAEVGELGCQLRRVSAHEPVIGLGRDLECHAPSLVRSRALFSACRCGSVRYGRLDDRAEVLRDRGSSILEDVLVDVQTAIDINRPRSDVSAYAADPDTATTWYENIKAVEWMTSRPLAVGSRFAFVARFLGRRLAYTYEVRDLVPGLLFVMSTADGPFPMETTYTWADTAAGGTRMTLRNRGEPSGFAGVAAPVMSRAMRRANRKDLLRLKEILESPPT